MKTLKDFIMNVSFEDVAQVLQKEYPKDWKGAGDGEGFEMVFNKLREMEPVPSKDGMKIVVERVKWEYDDPDLPDEEADDVYGKIDYDDTCWGLDFVPWAEWLGMEIRHNTIQKYSPEEIVAHCLWEMTFHGYFEETIQQKAEELKKAKEEIENGTDELVKFDPSIFLH